VIDPSFVGIVSFHGDDEIMSVSRGGEPDFEDFNILLVPNEPRLINNHSSNMN
jgi:hypothetical protein